MLKKKSFSIPSETEVGKNMKNWLFIADVQFVTFQILLKFNLDIFSYTALLGGVAYVYSWFFLL